ILTFRHSRVGGKELREARQSVVIPDGRRARARNPYSRIVVMDSGLLASLGAGMTEAPACAGHPGER
ncbi:MAG: hypothetical protein WBD97_01830, partial [Pseudolabrys sp.]